MFHVIVWKLTRQFSGQTQTVDIICLIISVLKIQYFKYTINDYNKLKGQDRTSHNCEA